MKENFTPEEVKRLIELVSGEDLSSPEEGLYDTMEGYYITAGHGIESIEDAEETINRVLAGNYNPDELNDHLRETLNSMSEAKSDLKEIRDDADGNLEIFDIIGLTDNND